MNKDKCVNYLGVQDIYRGQLFSTLPLTSYYMYDLESVQLKPLLCISSLLGWQMLEILL